MSNKVRLALVFIGVLLMGSGIVLTWRTVGDYADLTKFQDDLDDFNLTAASLIVSLSDYETGVHGYIATGKKEFLGPTRKVKKDLPEILALLQMQAGKAGCSVEDLADILSIASDKMDSVDQLIADMGNDPQKARAVLSSRDGKRIMDEVRTRVSALQEQTRERKSEVASQDGVELLRLRLVILFTGMGSLVTVVVLLLSYRSEIKKREKAGSELRRFRQAIDASADDVFIVDRASMSFVDVNETAIRNLGYVREKLVCMGLQDITTGLDRAELERRYDEVIASPKKEGLIEAVGRRKDASEFPVEIRLRALEADASGTRLLAVARDMTERLRHEAAVRQAREEADRANAAKSEFLSRMSHELRTPLNSILGYGQLMDTPKLDADQADNLEHIMKGGRHLLVLINEVLDTARIESGSLALSPESLLLGNVMAEVLDLIRPMANRGGIILHVESPIDAGVCVRADRQRLKQVFINILNNAVKYNREHGWIKVQYAHHGTDKIRILIADSGPGISQENQKKIFRPFERLAAGNSVIEGTGLGLTLSKRLVELMGGVIGVESEAGSGSTFWIELPTAEMPVEQERRASARTELADEAPDTKQLSVLYIEDNPDNLRLIQKFLAADSRVRLLTAMNGASGVNMARTHCPNLIILDLHLPDMSGGEVMLKIRSYPELRSIPVIILSADATPGQIQRLKIMGANEYLTKPLELSVLRNTLRKYFEPEGVRP